jgi:hypothetical protein
MPYTKVKLKKKHGDKASPCYKSFTYSIYIILLAPLKKLYPSLVANFIFESFFSVIMGLIVMAQFIEEYTGKVYI